MSSRYNASAIPIDRPCNTPDQLHAWIRLFTGLSIPRTNVCPHHSAPFDYICKSYFEPAPDLVVWAPRGGGKTRLAALATLLDLLHKPACSVRILGGSLEQSLRMWEHLLPDLERAGEAIPGRSGRRLRLESGGDVAVLTQSQRAVRGLRVQKLRCDEVELFDPAIWEAAQLVTRSKVGVAVAPQVRDSSGQNAPSVRTLRGSIEALSTHHSRGGLMGTIIDRAIEMKTPVVKWCVLEVLQKCPPERECASCPLWDECGGIAKTRCSGFLPIDDAISLKGRVSVDTWQAEMLCRRPSVSNSVFPRFDVAMHVSEHVPSGGEMSLAMDFGFHNPFVCLWIRKDENGVHVIDEYVQPQRVLAEHIAQIDARPMGRVRRVCCDPAGNGRNDQTAESNVSVLRREGFVVHAKASRIVDGCEMIRTMLNPASGEPTLKIHPRCKRLIEALQQYRYPDGGGELPLKDGVHDHPIDALRYYLVNQSSGGVVRRAY